MNISPEIASTLLRYEPDTGKMFWRERPIDMCGGQREWRRWNNRFAGKETFTSVDNRGYLKGSIFNQTCAAHRVAWVIAMGEWPPVEIDHINLVRTDNRLANLRLATKKQNMRNRKSLAGSSSTYLGVTWHKSRQKWQASVEVDGRCKYLGLHGDEASAARAYDAAALSYCGEFARLNFAGVSA